MSKNSPIGPNVTQNKKAIERIKALASKFPSEYAACPRMELISKEAAFFHSPAKLPRNIDYEQSSKLFSKITDSIILYNRKLLEAQGWQFFVVDQTRGACYHARRRITIPIWALQCNIEYLEWYISHEMAHAFAGHTAKHGEYFMAWLQAICPAYALHHETSYKPRNAKSIGISSDMETNILRNRVDNAPNSKFL